MAKEQKSILKEICRNNECRRLLVYILLTVERVLKGFQKEF